MGKFVIKNAEVFDSKAGIFEKKDLVVENDRVAAAEIVGEDVEVLDYSGKYIVPGIIDAHVHLVWDGTSPDPMSDTVRDGNYFCFARGVRGAYDSLIHGVTTVRDVGCNDDCTLPLSKAVRQGVIKGSNIVPAGSATQGSYGHCPMIGTIANTEAQLIERVKRLKGAHIENQIPPTHWMKIMASGGAAGLEDVGPCMYSPKELEALCYEAHRLNMKVAAHALSYDAISKCVEAGIDTIEHGADLDEEILIKMKEHGQTWVPTLAVYKELAAGRGVVADIIVDKSIIVTEKQKKAFKKAMEIGTNIIMGSDAGSANFGPHPSGLKEMAVMNEYGMPAAAVIQSATSKSAAILGIDKDYGCLEAGKKADFVILDKNPVEDIWAFTNNLCCVYKDGKLV